MSCHKNKMLIFWFLESNFIFLWISFLTILNCKIFTPCIRSKTHLSQILNICFFLIERISVNFFPCQTCGHFCFLIFQVIFPTPISNSSKFIKPVPWCINQGDINIILWGSPNWASELKYTAQEDQENERN